MRFLFINPFCPLSEAPTPPLGVAFLAAVLEDAGIEVKILDLVTYPYDTGMLESLLESFRPQIVGSTAVTMTFNEAQRVLKDARTIDPDIVTVMGGPHVTFCPEATLESFTELDLIVLGEGERTIVELAREAERGRDWSKIRGLAYRSGMEVRCNERRAPVDVDSLPLPARHLFPLGRYRALNMSISMATSRGCPFSCIFCVGRKMVGAKVRYRNPRSVVDELQYLGSLGFPQVNLADDLFTAKKEHCLAICNEIMDRGLQVKWACFARVDTVSPPVLRKMRQAGCSTVSFGVESANAEILRTIRKRITIPKVITAIEMCVEAGIQPHVSFILGLPGETPETLRETQEFGDKIDELGALYGFHLLAPFPGTAVRDENEKYDLKILSDDWSEYHANRAIVETSSVSREMLDAIVEEWDKEVAAKLGERAVSGGAADDGAPAFSNLERILVFYDLMMSRAIEEHGSWRNGSRPLTAAEAVRALASRVYGFTTRSERDACHILNYAVENGHLRCLENGEYVRWAWKDYL